MRQFTLESKHSMVLFGMMGLGVLCLLGSFFLSPDYDHIRSWTNLLHNSVFFTGIGFLATFILAVFCLAYGGWYVTFKRIWEAYSMFMIPGLVLMLLITAGVWGHWHHLYHWADAEAVAEDAILAGKSSFLNKYWYTLSTVIIVGVWIFFAMRFRQISLDEDKSGTASFSHHRKMRFMAAVFLPIAGFTSAAIVWQWIMSIDAHWYSTLFAWYTTASWFVSMLALTIITIVFLKSRGYLEEVNANHLHDLGKFLFAFSIFWTYLWFSQFMLIWYANVGEETVYFLERRDNYPVLFFGNLLINFVLPFFVLIRNDNKRKYGTMMFASIFVLFGHWWDFFLMIKPGALHTAQEAAAHAAGAGHDAEHAHGALAGFTLPGLLELGIFIGFLGFFFYFVFKRMEKAALVPKNDPYLEESLAHHV